MSRVLLIFARRPRPGRVKTRLSPFLTVDEAAGLYDCMVRDVVTRTADLEGVERVLCFEEEEGAESYFREVAAGMKLLPQDGEGLGERLCAAFAVAFRRGFTAAAVIGTDSPDLPLSFITEAFECIESGAVDVVFGPSEDGGYYLAAMGKPHPDLFRDVPWSTAQVLAVSRQRAASAGLRSALLPVWYDLDEPADLLRPGLRDKRNNAPRTKSFLIVRHIGG